MKICLDGLLHRFQQFFSYIAATEHLFMAQGHSTVTCAVINEEHSHLMYFLKYHLLFKMTAVVEELKDTSTTTNIN